MNEINWVNIKKFLIQQNKLLAYPKLDSEIQKLSETLMKMSVICGEFSKNKKMIHRIGVCLLNDVTTIMVPVCQDYTAKSDFGEIPPLVKRHVPFLNEMKELLPSIKIMFLLDDQEAYDEKLCLSIGKSQTEFLQCITNSLKATREYISPMGWSAFTTTDMIQDSLEKEKDAIEYLSGIQFKQRFITETTRQADRYLKVHLSITFEDMCKRSIKNAAQYVVLGNCAASHKYLLCTHTTINLNWYLQTQAAVLHDAVLL
ncbi:MAG: hypothetical protein M3Q63_02400 [bacterium]|nr:hypothetical protein [bacterium]